MSAREELMGVARLGFRFAVAAIVVGGAAWSCSTSDAASTPAVATRVAPLVAAPHSTVAIHVSETTAQFWTYTSWRIWHSVAYLSEALRSDGTPFETVSDADIASGVLMTNGIPTFPILISLDNEAISDAVAAQIQSYASSGGHVFVGGSSWTKTETGAPRPDFALASAMGLKSQGHWARTHDVYRIADSTMIDQLPLNAPKWWFLPSSFDVDSFAATLPQQDFDPDYGDSRQVHETSHWYWAATTEGVQAAATPLLKPFFQHIDVVNQDASPVPSDADAPGLPPPGFSESIYASSWATDYEVQIGDVNGDGRADLVGRNLTTGDVQAGLSTGQNFAPSTSWRNWNTGYTFQLADVNGDGCADVVGRPKTGGDDVQVGLSDGCSGGAVFRESSAWTNWSQTLSLQLADVNGDGGADLVGRALSGSEDVMVALSNKSNAFGSAARWTTWRQNTTLNFADVDGDGAADIVGRLIGGNDVQVGISNGGSGQQSFQGSTSWTTWDPAFTLGFADFDGDGDADIFGLNTANGVATEAPVGLSLALGEGGTRSFQPPLNWQDWRPQPWATGWPNTTTAFMDGQFVGDVNGDGRFDLVGRKGRAIAVWLSLGTSSKNEDVLLAIHPFGNGRFIYNATMQPLAGYSGDAKTEQEYKMLRVAIDEAFAARDQPLVRLAAWPFPSRAALIYRHDHVLNNQIVDLEQARGIQGEYYIQPDVRNTASTSCSGAGDDPSTDYPAGVASAVAKGAIIGAHLWRHKFPDQFPEDSLPTTLADTLDRIQCDTSQWPTAFTAPGYLGLLRSTLQEESKVFATSGDIGHSTFPAFSLDPDVAGQVVGALIQMPVSAIIPQQVWSDVCAGADVAYDTNGLVNVYDHGGSDAGGLGAGASMAATYLNWLFNGQAVVKDGQPVVGCVTRARPDILKTTSGAIRSWWLNRDGKTLAVASTTTATNADINVTMGNRPSRPAFPENGVAIQPLPAPFSSSNFALRIDLSPTLRGFAASSVRLRLNGIIAPASRTVIQDGPRGSQLAVRVGTATSVQIHLGP